MEKPHAHCFPWPCAGGSSCKEPYNGRFRQLREGGAVYDMHNVTERKMYSKARRQRMRRGYRRA